MLVPPTSIPATRRSQSWAARRSVAGGSGMRLRTVRIQNFKSIEDSTVFTVDDVTSLVGKNESGKTAALQALYKLNPVEKDEAEFNELEYPRRFRSKAQETGDLTKANVLTTTWELEDDEFAALEKAIGKDAIIGREVTVKKGYANTSYWTVPVDEEKVVADLITGAKLYVEERKRLADASGVAQLIERLTATTEPSERESKFLADLQARFKRGSAATLALDTLSPFLPKFVYFSNYEKLPGEVSLEQLVKKKAADTLTKNDRVFLALLELVGTTPDDINKLTKFEPLIAQLEAVSNRISDEIFEYWSQNKHLEVEFRFDEARPEDPAPMNVGHIFRTRIRNQRHRVTLNFDERSTGFVWFFSFLVWFSQVKRNYGERLFLLLDEPALSLHARAQEDLLRYIDEKLRPHYQVIYTTHSPFLIDPDNILSARTVEDVVGRNGEVLGTKVGDEVLSTDPDTVSPLQRALGLNLTQTLFVGKHTLLVEGPSDLLYITWASAELGARGRTRLDPRWVIAPTGGLDKIASFVTLFASQKLNVAVLADYHTGGKKKVRDLQESKLLQDGHVFTADTVAQQAEADTEDIIGRANYVALVNDTYNLTGPQQMPKTKPTDAPVRVVEETERHFRTLPPETPEYDHYTPSSKLITDAARLQKVLPELEAALDRFETLFKALNALLPNK
jgi:hypothetical protein